jgi:hypothetical protein
LVSTIIQHLDEYGLLESKGISGVWDLELARILDKREEKVKEITKQDFMPKFLGAADIGNICCKRLKSQRKTGYLFPNYPLGWEDIPTNGLPNSLKHFKAMHAHAIWLLQMPEDHGSHEFDDDENPFAYIRERTAGFYNLETLLTYPYFLSSLWHPTRHSMIVDFILPIFRDHPLTRFPRFNRIAIPARCGYFEFFRLDENSVMIRDKYYDA